MTRLLKFTRIPEDRRLFDQGDNLAVDQSPLQQPPATQKPGSGKQAVIRSRNQSQTIRWSRLIAAQKKKERKSQALQQQEKPAALTQKAPQTEIQKLQQRMEHLEQANRIYLDALELAKSFGDFQESINKLEEPQVILTETRDRAAKLIEFDVQAQFLMQEEDSNFRLADCDPKDMNEQVQQELEKLINDGVVAMAINDRRPVMVASRDNEYQLLIHVMATSSRVRGMFLGMIKTGQADIPEVLLSLLSILLNSSANALESFELYGLIRDQKAKLEELLRQRTGELTDLQDEMDIRVNKRLKEMQEKLDKAKEDVMAANMALTWFRDHCLLTEDE